MFLLFFSAAPKWQKKSIIAAITLIWSQIELAGYNWLKNQNIVTFMAQIIYNKCHDYSVLILWKHINWIIEFRNQTFRYNSISEGAHGCVQSLEANRVGIYRELICPNKEKKRRHAEKYIIKEKRSCQFVWSITHRTCTCTQMEI